MTRQGCEREEAVLAAAIDASDERLSVGIATHLEGCDDCRELYLIASSLRQDRIAAVARVRVPSAGQVWWRAELRARQEAAAAAARPITVATGLAAASLVGLIASLVGGIAWWFEASAHVPAAVYTAVMSVLTFAVERPASRGLWLAAMLMAGVIAVATPLLLYLATREE